MTLPRFASNTSVPTMLCPNGTKMWLLHLGILNVDDGWLLAGANGSSKSNPNPENKRRDLALLAGLIEHPEMGLILFETGCSEDVVTEWGPVAVDLFPRTEYEPQHHLPAAIEATGHNIADVKAVVIGHLHMDHAGGLEHFRNTNIPIYVHEEEFKYACWAVATKHEEGLFLPQYLSLDGTFNWKTFSGSQIDLCTGVTLYHCPGHTPGLCIMQVNLEKDGVFIWTTDQYHIKEQYEQGHMHGWLLRDYRAWVRSHEFVERLKHNTHGTLIYGHDLPTAKSLMAAKEYYE